MNQSAPLIEAAGLRRVFGSTVAVDGVTLHVNGGEIYGLVGPDGAGKTTTLRMLAGLLEPSAGSVRLIGADPFKSGSEVREVLGYMPQQFSLYGDLTVDENLAFFGEMFCLDRTNFDRRRKRLLAMTHLVRFGARRADALSGGMYKKLALACSLLHQPKLLLLDEPTNGVDPLSRREFWDLLREFLADGMAILLTTPYMDEAARCHRAGLLYAGRLLEEGIPAEMLNSLSDAVYHVIFPDGKRANEVIDNSDEIIASTFAANTVRIVVRRGKEPAILSKLTGAGARVEPVMPTFEDLFLARMSEQYNGGMEQAS